MFHVPYTFCQSKKSVLQHSKWVCLTSSNYSCSMAWYDFQEPNWQVGRVACHLKFSLHSVQHRYIEFDWQTNPNCSFINLQRDWFGTRHLHSCFWKVVLCNAHLHTKWLIILQPIGRYVMMCEGVAGHQSLTASEYNHCWMEATHIRQSVSVN